MHYDEEVAWVGVVLRDDLGIGGGISRGAQVKPLSIPLVILTYGWLEALLYIDLANSESSMDRFLSGEKEYVGEGAQTIWKRMPRSDYRRLRTSFAAECSMEFRRWRNGGA